MNHNINEGHVKMAVARLNSVLGSGEFSTAEIVVALGEFTGRVMVQLADTPVAGFQCAQALGQHVKDTMVAGYTAKGFNMKGGA